MRQMPQYLRWQLLARSWRRLCVPPALACFVKETKVRLPMALLQGRWGSVRGCVGCPARTSFGFLGLGLSGCPPARAHL